MRGRRRRSMRTSSISSRSISAASGLAQAFTSRFSRAERGHSDIVETHMKNITFLLASILITGSASAQQPAARAAAPAVQTDARFAGWLGCWRLDDDLAGTGARMCITPEKNGVRL